MQKGTKEQNVGPTSQGQGSKNLITRAMGLQNSNKVKFRAKASNLGALSTSDSFISMIETIGIPGNSSKTLDAPPNGMHRPVRKTTVHWIDLVWPQRRPQPQQPS